MPAAARKPRPPATPRYIAIAALVRDRITTEQLGPHTLLPSERELAEQHGVSRMTARQALSLLESEGVVYRKPPRGTFVAEPRVRFHIGSFSEEVSRLGRRPAARLMWAEHQHPTPGGAAGARPRRRRDGQRLSPAAHRRRRPVRAGDDVPARGSDPRHPRRTRRRLAMGDPARAATASTWPARPRYWNPSSSTMRPARSSACAQDRRAPCSPAAPRTAAGRCVEYARDVYRADRASFEVSELLGSHRLSAV